MTSLAGWDDGYQAIMFGLLEDGSGIPNSVDDAGGNTWVSEGSSCFWIVVSYFPKSETGSGRIDPGYTNSICMTVIRDGTITSQTVY